MNSVNKCGNKGVELYSLIEELYPICRSITGNGVRKTLSILQNYIPLQVHEVATGTTVFDWEVPKEWNIKDAYIKDSSGTRVVDFHDSNLHVVNYSIPVKKKLSLDELKKHIHTLPDKPDWIPYRTSYYKETWGFSLAHTEAEKLQDETYEVVIDSSLTKGHLTYGEFYIPGESSEEILLSTHICHPSLCNDNLSGIAVMTALARFLSDTTNRYSYRFIFIPATIGSITWLALNKENAGKIKHGLVGANLGDNGHMHYKKTRKGNTELDQAANIVLRDATEAYEIIDFFPYGYDERQFCSPGFNLSVGSIMRTPHGQFPEYHTSADNLDFIHPEYLENSYRNIRKILYVLGNNRVYKNTNPYCEPQLGKRGLYKHIGGTDAEIDQLSILWVLNLSDGENSLLDIADRSKIAFNRIKSAAELLIEYELLEYT